MLCRDFASTSKADRSSCATCLQYFSDLDTQRNTRYVVHLPWGLAPFWLFSCWLTGILFIRTTCVNIAFAGHCWPPFRIQKLCTLTSRTTCLLSVQDVYRLYHRFSGCAPLLFMTTAMDSRCVNRVGTGCAMGGALGASIGNTDDKWSIHPSTLAYDPRSNAMCLPHPPEGFCMLVDVFVGAAYGTFEAFRYKVRAVACVSCILYAQGSVHAEHQHDLKQPTA